jgi:hypothetical protein
MSVELYEKTAFMQDIFLKLDEGETDIEEERTADANDAAAALRLRHDLQR